MAAIRSRLILAAGLFTAALAATPGQASTTPHTTPHTTPAPGPGAELRIGLEVAGARCDGRHGQMIARYAPQLLRLQADALRQDEAAMVARYRRAHGEGWEAALQADLARYRSQLQAVPDVARFCRQQALEARTMVFAGAGDVRLASGVTQGPTQAFESFMLGRPARGPRSPGFP